MEHNEEKEWDYISSSNESIRVYFRRYTRRYRLPDGGFTTNKDEAAEAWELHNLIRNVTCCHIAGRLAYCYKR